MIMHNHKSWLDILEEVKGLLPQEIRLSLKSDDLFPLINYITKIIDDYESR